MILNDIKSKNVQSLPLLTVSLGDPLIGHSFNEMARQRRGIGAPTIACNLQRSMTDEVSAGDRYNCNLAWAWIDARINDVKYLCFGLDLVDPRSRLRRSSPQRAHKLASLRVVERRSLTNTQQDDAVTNGISLLYCAEPLARFLDSLLRSRQRMTSRSESDVGTLYLPWA
jgi:hypothetical protein